jgi:soluble lytic murein transglycosylase-like protein
VRIFGRGRTRPRGGGALGQRLLSFRISRRLLELSLGVAILPAGTILGVGLTSSQPALASAATPGAGLASTLVRFHNGPLVAGILSDPAVGEAPTLATLPPAPRLSTPRPRPRAAAVPSTHYAPGSIQGIITAAADHYGVNPNWMISTAECESGLNPNAYNPSGPYYGLFQFLKSTFEAHGGTDIWNPTQQSNIAASMFASGDSSAWPVCSHA